MPQSNVALLISDAANTVQKISFSQDSGTGILMPYHLAISQVNGANVSSANPLPTAPQGTSNVQVLSGSVTVNGSVTVSGSGTPLPVSGNVVLQSGLVTIQVGSANASAANPVPTAPQGTSNVVIQFGGANVSSANPLPTAPQGTSNVVIQFGGSNVSSGNPLPTTVVNGSITITGGTVTQQVSGANVSFTNPLPTSAVYVASGVAPVSNTLISSGATSSFTPTAGRTFHVQLTGNAVCQCVLERQLDGANWVPITATAGGITTTLYNWSYSANSLSEDVVESQSSVPYRVDCGANNGSFSSGTLNVRFSQ